MARCTLIHECILYCYRSSVVGSSKSSEIFWKETKAFVRLSGAREAVEMSHFPALCIFCCCLCILAVHIHDAAVPVSVRVGSWSPLQRQRFFPPGLISVRRVHSARGIRRGCENGNETFTKTEHLSIPYLHHIVLAAKTQNPRPLPQIPKISVPQLLGLSLRVNTVI